MNPQLLSSETLQVMSLTSQCFHHVKVSDVKSIARNQKYDVVVVKVEGRLLRAGAKSTESLKLKPATLAKSIAEVLQK